MDSPLVLAYDVGTQSVRAMLVDTSGNIVAMTKDVYEQPYYSLRPNWAEQKPDYYFQHICAVTQRLKDQSPAEFHRITGFVLTAFRDSTVCMDKNGRPLRDSILWLDQRKATDLKPIPKSKQALFAVVGMAEAVDMLYHNSMCNWIAENEPEIWAATDKNVMLSTYLNYRFTGEIRDGQASAIAKIPFDYKNRTWDTGGLTRCLYDVPDDKLFEVVPSGTIIGRVTPEASRLTGLPEGLPLIATGADKACETLGLSVIHENQAAISLGTSATIEFASSRYFEPTPFMPSYPAVPNNLYNGEIQLYRGYWMLSWFKDNFAKDEVDAAKYLGCSAEELLDKKLTEIPPGCDGLMVLPHWTPGLDTPGARGAMIGFTDHHTKYHMYRAIIEGINFGLMDGMYNMEKSSHQRIEKLYIGGGGSRSGDVCQITADMFGLPVSRIQTNESCGLGAAMCAFVSTGEFEDYESAIASMVRIKDTFYPNKENHALYEQLYRDVYSKTYKTLMPLHKRLAAILSR